MTDQKVTAEFSVSRTDGTYTSSSATRDTEHEAIAALWRLIGRTVEHAIGTAALSRPTAEETTR